MKRMIRISTFVFASILGAASMTACGNSNSFLDTPNESAVETADGQSDKAETETSSEVEKSETDDAYAPTDEIMNADFQSGKIQIGNDVFRNGGYYKVDQFIEEYGDRYDMSAIDTESVLNEQRNLAVIISKSDPEIQLSVEYITQDVEIRTGNAVVVQVKPNKYTADGPFICYPTGQNSIDTSKTIYRWREIL